MSGKTYMRSLQELVAKYRKAGNPWPAQSIEIAQWAYEKGLWKPYQADIMRLLARDLSQSMRTEYFIDGQGRKVRRKYPVRKKVRDEWGVPRQTFLWADANDATREHMEMHFQQRRQQRVGEIIQLKTDLDSYNENRNPGPAIQLSWDFTEDIADHEAPDTHPDLDASEEGEFL